MRKLGIAIGILLVVVLGLSGLELLQASFSQGESLLPAVLLLVIPLLVAGFLVAAVLRRLVRPLRDHGNLTGLIGLAVSAGLGFWLYALNSSIPLQRPDASVTAAVAPACAGQAVAAAGRVTTGSTALNHIVVLNSSGAEFGWTGKASVDWRPPTVAEVELVACVEPEDAVSEVEVCRYNGPSTTRYSAKREVRVMAAQTGAELARFSILVQPDRCPGAKVEDLPKITATVDWWQVEDHLDSLVRTGSFTDPDAAETPYPGETLQPSASTEPAWTPEPTAAVRAISLAKAISEGLVTAKGSSDSLQLLGLTITSKSDSALRVNIPAGTYFLPKRAATQTMVAIAATWVDVPARKVVTAGVDVACAQMHDDQPGETGKSDAFTVRAGLAKGDLAKLLKSDAFAAAAFRLQQFAVWTITSNPSRSGYVNLGTFGVGSRPSSAELREIKSIFKDAGIATGAYRALP